jgi:hypothetical protein
VLNPVASIDDMQRHLCGEPKMFGCLAGWKSFYLDWHLALWRCHNWDRQLCDIRDSDGTQRLRDGVTACMIDCWRDASVMHRNQRRHAGGNARRFSASLAALDGQAQRDLCAGGKPDGQGLAPWPLGNRASPPISPG